MNTRKRNNSNGWEEFGGYMAARKKKLKDQFNKEQDLHNNLDKQIFKGICIYVDGFTNPPAHVLRNLMVEHGGKFAYKYKKREVTHLVTDVLPKSKIDNLKNDIVVKPQWITDCIKAEKLLPCLEYRLYMESSSSKLSNIFTRKTPTIKEDPTQNDNVKEEISSQLPDTVEDVDRDTNLSHFNNDEDFDISTPDIGSSNTLKQGSEELITNDKKDEVKKPLMMKRAGQPGFLADFYSNSRLHHLSSWATELRNYVSELKQNIPANNGELLLTDSSVVSAAGGGVNGKEKIIMHLDMDCFFVSVGLRNRPELKDKPVAVTHSKGNGPLNNTNREQEFLLYERVYGMKLDKMEGMTNSKPRSMAEISSCSYKAREAGLKNGMFLGRAKEMCPDLITIPYDFQGYKEVSEEMFKILVNYTHNLEVVSCDEAYLDVTSLLSRCPGVTADQLASRMRQEIFDSTGCTASVGIGANLLLARIATKKAKPNGQCYLRGEELKLHLHSMPVKDLPGVGWSMVKHFNQLDCQTCGNLQNFTLSKLQNEFGTKIGLRLYKNCRGEDSRQLEALKERKSVSVEVNYGIRFIKKSEYEYFLTELCEELSNRLKKAGMKGRSISVKLLIRHPEAPVESSKFMGHGMCNHMNKTITLPVATDDPRLIRQECVCMMRVMAVVIEDIRGMGIHIQKLELADKSLLKKNKEPTGLLKFFKHQQPTTSKVQHQPPINSTPKSLTAGCSNDQKSLASPSLISPIVIEDPGDNSYPQSLSSFISSTPKTKCRNEINLPVLPRPPRIYEEKMMPDPARLSRVNIQRISNHPADILQNMKADSIPIHSDQPDSPVHQPYVIPPYSQIDDSILNALPEEIRKELYPDMSSPSTPTPLQPGPSHLPVPKSDRDGKPVEELPSESQIDLSVFEALPPNVRLELRAALNVKRKQSEAADKNSPLSSPVKNEGKRGVLSVRRGRGRGRGASSARFPVDNGTKQMRLNFFQAMEQQQPVEIEVPPIIIDVDKESDPPVELVREEELYQEEEDDECPHSPQKIDEKCSTNPMEEFRKKPCNEIRSFLDKWLQSTSNPSPIDEEFYLTFLLESLRSNLELVKMSLLKVRRIISNENTPHCLVSDDSWNQSWKILFNKTLARVQSECCNIYKARLRIEPL